MWYDAEVFMLSTNEKAVRLGQLVIGAGNNLFSSRQSNDIGSLTAYELYITSDEAIKEGDWYYDCESKVKPAICRLADDELPMSYDRKIIAYTDDTLNIPQPSQAFITKFVEEYNKGNVITKVMVEYVQVPNSVFIQVLEAPYIQLKINSDNTINIKPIKDNWNLDEIKVFAVKCFNAGRQYQIDSIDIFNDKWIEENLL